MAQEIMDFVRDDQLLERNAARAQFSGQRDRLVDPHVAIIIAVDQQGRATPAGDIGQRR